MPTSAKTPDQRSDRYLRYIEVGPQALARSACPHVWDVPRSAMLRVAIPRHQIQNMQRSNMQGYQYAVFAIALQHSMFQQLFGVSEVGGSRNASDG
jgi:hypothetical protein